jgi:hypothetical protein
MSAQQESHIGRPMSNGTGRSSRCHFERHKRKTIDNRLLDHSKSCNHNKKLVDLFQSLNEKNTEMT